MQKSYLILFLVAVVTAVLAVMLAIALSYMPSEGSYPIVVGRALSAMLGVSVVCAVFTYANWHGTTWKVSWMNMVLIRPIPMRMVIAGVAFLMLGLMFIIFGREDMANASKWANYCLWITVALYAVAFFFRGMIPDKDARKS